jgi:erythromycin esterase
VVATGKANCAHYRADAVGLVGFASHRGEVIAAAEWGLNERVLEVPIAIRGTHEDLLHSALGYPAVLEFGSDRSGPWLRSHRGHRAIGVVYQPRHEFGNYVPTVMGRRYDALIWLEDTTPLEPLRHEPPPREAELETAPSGF